MHTHMYTYIHIYIQAHTHITQTCTHIHLHIHMRAHTHTTSYTCTYMHTHSLTGKILGDKHFEKVAKSRKCLLYGVQFPSFSTLPPLFSVAGTSTIK